MLVGVNPRLFGIRLSPYDTDGFCWFTVQWLLWSITADYFVVIWSGDKVGHVTSGGRLSWVRWVVVPEHQLPLQHLSVQQPSCRYVPGSGQTSHSQPPLCRYQSHQLNRNALNLRRGKLQTRVRAIMMYSTRNPTWEIISRARENWVCFLAVDGKPIGTCFVVCLIHCSACVLIQAENKSHHAHSWPCFLRTDPQIMVRRKTIFGLPDKVDTPPRSSVGYFPGKEPVFQEIFQYYW